MPNEPLFERPLEELLAPPKKKAKAPVHTPAPTKTRDRSPTELLALARAQKRTLFLLVATVLFHVVALVGIFALRLTDPDELLLDLVIVVCTGVSLVLLVCLFVQTVRFTAWAYEAGGVALMVFLWVFFWPLSMGLVWLLAHFKANSIFHRNGIRTGLLGASSSALREIDPSLQHETQLPRLGW